MLFRVILGLMPDPLISFRIPSSERRDLEKFCRKNKLSLSMGIRKLIQAHLRTPYDLILPDSLSLKLEKISDGSERYGVNDLIRQAVIQKFGE